MKRLLLLRHAKSLRDDAMRDRDRPLNERGRTDAPCMGVYMHRHRYLPDAVLCSPARRTVETWNLLAPELAARVEVRFPESLYLASAAMIVKLIRSTESTAAAMLVIAHNPGLAECAGMLARPATDARERKRETELQNKFPTCALAVLEFEMTSWKDIVAASGVLTDYARPKSL